MSDDLSAVEFRSKYEEGGKWPKTMAELVEGWIAYWNYRNSHTGWGKTEFDWAPDCEWHIVQHHGGLGMDFVLAVLASKPSHKVIEVLAAGPLEDLLGYQGPNIIDRVEDEARRSPEFRHLLGGVRKSGFMTDDVWQRMIKVAPERWW